MASASIRIQLKEETLKIPWQRRLIHPSLLSLQACIGRICNSAWHLKPGRVQELARLLAGENRSGTVLGAARELLAQYREP